MYIVKNLVHIYIIIMVKLTQIRINSIKEVYQFMLIMIQTKNNYSKEFIIFNHKFNNSNKINNDINKNQIT